jgi:hypothetical protein
VDVDHDCRRFAGLRRDEMGVLGLLLFSQLWYKRT